ncbi:hypothetical protein NBRC103581_01084 [Gluconobacter wancherniae NBRC 103581]|nr:hypothetical protein NBRC103581_01084 [Gluconobacter wancherniae NBRC 103581]
MVSDFEVVNIIFGCVRISTQDQQYVLQAQIDELRKQGCERVYSE